MAGIPTEATCTLGDEAGALGSSDANSRMDVENHSCSKGSECELYMTSVHTALQECAPY